MRAMRMTRSLATAIFAIVALLAGVGCASSSVSIPQWQHAVEQYVRVDGQGDANALRDTTIEGGRPGFGLIAADDPQSSTDVKGLLLAHKRIDNRPWFIYLVGLIKKQEVSELRLAALNVQGGKFNWVMGKSD